MHRSRLGGFIIDCQTDDLAGAGRFWAAALGMEMSALPGEEGERYVKLAAPDFDMHLEVQRVTHASRVHLDIETDDIEAEVARLEELGARRVEWVKSWCVMEAPTGQRFCVVNAGTRGFAAHARTWQGNVSPAAPLFSHLSHVRIFVHDHAQAVAFYRDTLGLVLDYAAPGVAIFSAGGTSLLIERADPPDQGDGPLVGRFAGVSLTTTDIASAYERLRARGVEFLHAPEAQPWGGIMTHFRDPAGNVLTVVQTQVPKVGA